MEGEAVTPYPKYVTLIIVKYFWFLDIRVFDHVSHLVNQSVKWIAEYDASNLQKLSLHLHSIGFFMIFAINFGFR